MTKTTDRTRAMLLMKHQSVQERLAKLESILRQIPCESYTSETALTKALAERYRLETGDKLDSSTLRRPGSPYKSLVNSFYESKQRNKQQQSELHRKQEELLLAKSEIYQLGLEIQSLKNNLSVSLAQLSQLRLENLGARTDSAPIKADVNSATEVAAFKVIHRLIVAGAETSGFEVSADSVTYISGMEIKVAFSRMDCPKFFEWLEAGSR